MQKVFDTDNADDMAMLWSMLSDDVVKITKRTYNDMSDLIWYNNDVTCESPFAINWHDKTEITRPIKEATEADLGKLCKFWDDACEDIIIGKLTVIETLRGKMCYRLGDFACFDHCRRLTKQEIEDLC